MAFEEYENSGRSTGKCLYQLCEIGVPVHIADTVEFATSGTIKYKGALFATFVWIENDVPVFRFYGDYEHYNEKLTQDECYSVLVILPDEKEYTVLTTFGKVRPYDPVGNLASGHVRVVNRMGHGVHPDTLKELVMEEANA